MDYLSPLVRKMQLEQLEAIRSDPAAILDLGSIPAAEGVGDALERRYPKSQRIIVDVDRASKATNPDIRSDARSDACSDAPSDPPQSRLSLSPESADLLIATLSLSAPSPQVLRECRQALRPQGLMMLGVLGESSLDTLARLGSMAEGALAGSTTAKAARKEMALREDLQRLRIALDMQRLGDAFFEAGFADVVVDVERVFLGQAEASTLASIMRSSAGSPAGSPQATMAAEDEPGERDDLGMPQAPLSRTGGKGSGTDAAEAMMEILFVHARCPQAQGLREGENKGVVFPEFRPIID